MLTFWNKSFYNKTDLQLFIEVDSVPKRKFVKCSFEKVNLTGIVFGSSYFKNCIFNYSIFRKSLFLNCKFESCKIKNCYSTRAELDETAFTNCSFEKIDFPGSDLDNCKFELTTFSKSNLDCMVKNVKIKHKNCENWIDIKDFSYFMNESKLTLLLNFITVKDETKIA